MNQKKSGLHPRNLFNERYDFPTLVKKFPELSAFVQKNKHGEDSIDFANPQAVKIFNGVLLKQAYQLKFWDIPKDYLCPPIPGRSDYIHHLADLIGKEKSSETKILDIGVGANCIYPLIGHLEYGWQFVGSDVDAIALKNAEEIISQNHLENFIKLRKQTDLSSMFKNIIEPGEFFQATICNPPFHASKEEAQAGALRKWKGLGKKLKDDLNFGGRSNELWCAGGEVSFISKMIKESLEFKKQVGWFTTLVSKETHLPKILGVLKDVNADHKLIDVSHGQKKSRIVVWRFL